MCECAFPLGVFKLLRYHNVWFIHRSLKERSAQIGKFILKKKRLSSKLFTWFANIVRRALSDYMEIEIVLLKHVFLFVCFLFLFVVEIFHYSFGQWIGSEQNHLCKCPNCVVIFYSSISLITLRMIVIHSDRHQCIYLYVFIELFFFSICLFSRFFSLLKP